MKVDINPLATLLMVRNSQMSMLRLSMKKSSAQHNIFMNRVYFIMECQPNDHTDGMVVAERASWVIDICMI